MKATPRTASKKLPLHALFLLLLFSLSPACQPTTNNTTTPPHPDEAQIRKAVDHYFATWSTQNMDAYGDCFHPQARIFFLTPGGNVISQPLGDFLHSQRMAHAQARDPMKEVPITTRILMDNKGAQAHVTWLLTKGSSHEKGVDLFSFIKQGKDWKIISLVFYEE